MRGPQDSQAKLPFLSSRQIQSPRINEVSLRDSDLMGINDNDDEE